MASKKTGAAAPGYNWARANLITEAGVLARRANQRLREIEKQGIASSSNAYKFVERSVKEGKFWATRGTQKASAGKIKFNTNLRAMTDIEIQKEMKLLKQFLAAPTSLTRGVRKKVEKLTEKFNKSTGQEYTTDEFQEIMTEDLVKEMFKIFDPSEIMALFAENPEYAKNADRILSALVASKHQSLSEMDFMTVADAFHNWKPSTADSIDPEEMEDIASFGFNM